MLRKIGIILWLIDDKLALTFYSCRWSLVGTTFSIGMEGAVGVAENDDDLCIVLDSDV